MMRTLCPILIACLLACVCLAQTPSAPQDARAVLRLRVRVKVGDSTKGLSRKRFFLTKGSLEQNRSVVEGIERRPVVSRDCYYRSAGASEALKAGSGFRLGGRFNFNSGRFYGHEIGVGYNRSSLAIGPDKSGMGMIQVAYAFLLHALPEGSAVRPFVCGGGGFSSFYPPGTSVSTGGFTKFGYNYGAGVKFKVSEKYGMRLDLRDYVTGKPFGDFADVRGRLHAIEVSAGFGIVF